MYSTPGTIGSIIDILGAQHRIFGTASAIGDGPALMNWPNGGEFPTLNNANEYFCVALLNAASYAGANFSVNMEWTENTY
jgi:hypothetical protein